MTSRSSSSSKSASSGVSSSFIEPSQDFNLISIFVKLKPYFALKASFNYQRRRDDLEKNKQSKKEGKRQRSKPL